MNSSCLIAEQGQPCRNTAIAILASGQSSRFGGSKLDAELKGRPLGDWVIRSAEQAGFTRQMIVVGPTAPCFVDGLTAWEIVTNTNAADGMGTSIAAAAKAVSGSSRLVIALADMPLISARHLRELRATDAITFTSYPDGKPGAPAAFPPRCFERLGTLSGDHGAASIGWEEATERLLPPADSKLDDVDTLASLAHLRATIQLE